MMGLMARPPVPESTVNPRGVEAGVAEAGTAGSTTATLCASGYERSALSSRHLRSARELIEAAPAAGPTSGQAAEAGLLLAECRQAAGDTRGAVDPAGRFTNDVKSRLGTLGVVPPP
jgi:hypothetical protein